MDKRKRSASTSPFAARLDPRCQRWHQRKKLTMKNLTLVGQMDSPFVRRVAITLTLYRLPFELSPLSVYSDFDALRRIHPLGTVPLLLEANGTVRSETEAICAWLDTQTSVPLRRPSTDELEAIGWANTMASKAGELYRLHRWAQGGTPALDALARIRVQLDAGLSLLDTWLKLTPPAIDARAPFKPSHADIAVVCGLRFAQMVANATGLSLNAPATLESALALRERHSVFAQCSAT
jgi:glutathione S-transferase